MAPRWSEDMTIKFLELYKDRPCLWDQFSDQYKNKNVREATLGEIVSAMNIEGFGITEAKSKIKALRATYIGEMIKVEKSAKSGCGSADLYVPSLKWLHIMQYIMEKGTLKRKTKSSWDQIAMVKREASIDLDNKESSDEFEVCDEAELDSKEMDSEEEIEPGTAVFICENQLEEAQALAPSPKRLKPWSKIQQIAETTQELKSLSASIKSISENEHDVYGKHVAAQLKKLSPRQAIIAMSQMNCILTECRLADLD